MRAQEIGADLKELSDALVRGAMPNLPTDKIIARTVTSGSAASPTCPHRGHLITGGRMWRSARIPCSIASSSSRNSISAHKRQAEIPASPEDLNHLREPRSLSVASGHFAQESRIEWGAVSSPMAGFLTVWEARCEIVRRAIDSTTRPAELLSFYPGADTCHDSYVGSPDEPTAIGSHLALSEASAEP